jgi:hypothetical protein
MRRIGVPWYIDVPLWVYVMMLPFLLVIWLVWGLLVVSVCFIALVTRTFLWLFGAVRR